MGFIERGRETDRERERKREKEREREKVCVIARTAIGELAGFVASFPLLPDASAAFVSFHSR
jgi:hypothetical protein